MKFQYTHLQEDSIRLLRFSSYSTPGFLHGWLDHQRDYRSESAHYSAIWFDQKDSSADEKKTVTLNGRSLVLPDNLWYALSAILEHHHTGTTRYWGEAVCVNHQDLTERNEQVYRLPKIFSCADRVFVWLGPEDEHTEEAFTAISERAKSCPCIARLEHQVTETQTKREAAAVESLSRKTSFQNASRDLTGLQNRNIVLICGKFSCSAEQFDHYHQTSTSRQDGALESSWHGPHSL